MRAGAAVPSLFLGATPQAARRYLADVLKRGAGRYARIHVPCSGRFTGAVLARKAGFAPDRIFCSDISLFSNLIGYLAAGKDPRSLGARITEALPALAKRAAETADDAEYVACILVAIKSGSVEPTNFYKALISRDLEGAWERHLAKVKAGLVSILEHVKGVQYEARDLFDVISPELAADDLLYVDPPGFAGGYKKQFSQSPTVEYEDIPIPQFSPKEGFAEVARRAEACPGLVLTLRAGTSFAEDSERVVWAMEDGARVKYLTANRKADVVALGLRPLTLVRKPEKVTAPRMPVWGQAGDIITAESKLSIQATSKEVGLYYRDLFAHTLGATLTEKYYLMILDGKVFGTIGMHLANATVGKPYDEADGRLFAWESFGFSSRTARYPKHLNRLLMMCVTCEEFLTVLKRNGKFPLGDPVGIRTACITKGHESKGNRGILKLISREKRDDGRFHIVYQTTFRPGGFAEQLRQWVTKYGAQTPGGNGGEE